MYDELVKRLRERCVFLFPHHGESRSYDADLMHEAADAIEELRAAVEGYEANTNMVFDRSGNNTVIKFEPKWIPVTEDTPSDFLSVQAHMTDAGPFPSVREAYTVDGLWFFPALKEFHPVDMWKRFEEPPKEE